MLLFEGVVISSGDGFVIWNATSRVRALIVGRRLLLLCFVGDSRDDFVGGAGKTCGCTTSALVLANNGCTFNLHCGTNPEPDSQRKQRNCNTVGI